MKFFLLPVLLLSQGALAKFENAREHLNKPYVLLISIDGYRYDYNRKFGPPALKNFARKGIRAKGLIPVHPSETFPNHYSIATGLRADKHGIVANNFYDRARRQRYWFGKDFREMAEDGSWYKGEPLWVATAKAQMVSASYFWVGSDANIQGIYPTYYYPYNQQVPNRKRIEQVLKWFKLPAKTRPHFVMLYFSDIDKAGHNFGPNSPKTKAEVLKLDKELNFLFKELKKINLDINTIVLSDHGMDQIKKTLYISDYINPSDKVRIEGQGANLQLYIEDSAIKNKLYKKLKKVPHFDIYQREKFPLNYARHHTERIGDLILSVHYPYYLSTKKPSKKVGAHGYHPFKNKNMWGIFYARGPQISNAGEIAAFQNIHVYPFVMKILGLKIKTRIDGKTNILSPYLNLN